MDSALLLTRLEAPRKHPCTDDITIELECSMHADLARTVLRVPYRKAHKIPRPVVHNRGIVDAWRECQSHHLCARVDN